MLSNDIKNSCKPQESSSYSLNYYMIWLQASRVQISIQRPGTQTDQIMAIDTSNYSAAAVSRNEKKIRQESINIKVGISQKFICGKMCTSKFEKFNHA